MNAAALLRHLEGQGVRLEVEGERLQYTAPAGVLTPALLEELRLRKPELMKLLPVASAVERGDALELVAAWRGAARELGEIAGHPELRFKSGHHVAPGAANWGTFIAHASVPDLRLVVAALRERLHATPRPEEER